MKFFFHRVVFMACCKCSHVTRKFTCPKCGHRLCNACKEPSK